MTTLYPNHPQYVPILKWQKWERLALKNTEATVAHRVLPCIEVRDSKQHECVLSEYTDTWSLPALVDYANPLGQLSKDREKELAEFLKLVKGSAAYASPVLNPAYAPQAFTLIKAHLGARKITLRVRLGNLADAATHVGYVKAALATPGLAAATDRLIVDLGETPAGVGATEAAALVTQLKAMQALGFPYIHFASGAFPASLMHINGAGAVLRRDWDFWAQIAAADPSLLVGYSDYGPLTPSWTEEQLTRRGSRAVIRYALDDKWRILRASTITKSDSVAISNLMVTAYASEYKGPSFSFGDSLIDERANPFIPLKQKRCGQYHIAEYWSHHIAHVVKNQY